MGETSEQIFRSAVRLVCPSAALVQLKKMYFKRRRKRANTHIMHKHKAGTTHEKWKCFWARRHFVPVCKFILTPGVSSAACLWRTRRCVQTEINSPLRSAADATNCLLRRLGGKLNSHKCTQKKKSSVGSCMFAEQQVRAAFRWIGGTFPASRLHLSTHCCCQRWGPAAGLLCVCTSAERERVAALGARAGA